MWKISKIFARLRNFLLERITLYPHPEQILLATPLNSMYYSFYMRIFCKIALFIFIYGLISNLVIFSGNFMEKSWQAYFYPSPKYVSVLNIFIWSKIFSLNKYWSKLVKTTYRIKLEESYTRIMSCCFCNWNDFLSLVNEKSCQIPHSLSFLLIFCQTFLKKLQSGYRADRVTTFLATDIHSVGSPCFNLFKQWNIEKFMHRIKFSDTI